MKERLKYELVADVMLQRWRWLLFNLISFTVFLQQKN